MKSWYRRLNIYFKTVLWTIIITLGVTICLIPLFFFNLMEIPLGILLGGIFGSLYYLIAGFNQREEYSKKGMILDVVTIILRFALFAGAVIGLTLLYYKANIHLFNVYGFAGAYLLSLFAFIIISGKESKK